MKKTLNTHELDQILKTATSIDNYLDKLDFVYKSVDFKDYMDSLLHKYNTSGAEIVKQTQIDRTYIYQIISGTRRGSRDKIIQIGIAISASHDEIQRLLKISGYSPLYTKVKRDAIIKFGIQKKMSLFKINDLLYEYYEKPLFEKE
ncbi:MAG: hypothetical protein JW702_06435 [Clostridiales bacterium]|nr:hypothetical protein [Clostridiales bacterium]